MNFPNKIQETYYNIKSNKKYFLAYIILALILILTVTPGSANTHFKFNVLAVMASLILGFFCLSYYFNHKDEPHKVAFVTIICFGIICAFIIPILSAPDEAEHYARSILSSQGSFFPHYIKMPSNYTDINNMGWCVDTTQSFFDLFKDHNNLFIDATTLNVPINNTHAWCARAFLHNPFYGYLPQGFGIFLANLLNLNVAWTLIFGRICNIIVYGALISIAIKKTPILKMPMLFMALLPLAVYQGATMSIDPMVNGLGFVAIAYFLYLFKSDENSISLKEIGILSIIILLLSLTKLTYLVFILLLLCIPKDKFKIPYYYTIMPIIIVSALVLGWSHFTTPIYDFSRLEYYVANNVNSTLQMNYLISHPTDSVLAILNIFPNIFDIFYNTFTFFTETQIYTSYSLIILGMISFIVVSFLYPLGEKISLKYKLLALFIIAVNFFGTYIIQLLKWTPVSQIYAILGVQSRYFIPFFALIPFICNINFDKINVEDFDKAIMVISLSLLVGLISTLVFKTC